MDPETELMLRIGRGDDGALKELYDRLSGNVFTLALQMLRSREDAEEVLQDTFVKVFENAARFETARGSVRAYLYTIARNEARQRLRAKRSRPRKIDDIDLHEPESPFVESRPTDHVERITVQQAFAQLEPEDVVLLEGSFFAGYSHGELAERTDTPLGTVKSRIRRSLLKLQAFLEEG